MKTSTHKLKFGKPKLVEMIPNPDNPHDFAHKAKVAEKATYSLLAEVEEEFGEAQERTRVLEAALASLTFDEFSKTLPFDPMQQYCQKTGQICGSHNPHVLHKLHAMHGDDKSRFVLTLLQQSPVAAHWLVTDGDSLDKLQIADPYGYFVFAAGHIVEHNYTAEIVGKQNLREARARLQSEKILTYRFAYSLPATTIHIANHYLRLFLSIDPKLTARWKSPMDILQLVRAGKLFSTLQQLMREFIQREITFANAEDVAYKLQKSKGPSNIAKQRAGRKKPISEFDKLMQDMLDIGIDLPDMRKDQRDAKAELRRMQREERLSNKPKSREEKFMEMFSSAFGDKIPASPAKLDFNKLANANKHMQPMQKPDTKPAFRLPSGNWASKPGIKLSFGSKKEPNSNE